ncbi:MAG: DUF2148 domain-containing protein [Bacteroidota bacterium]|nr:DUF2148 domain-containing protein [Bacteroidota bacterium]
MIRQEEISNQYILSTAMAMASAARTAPKARGVDNLTIAICDKDDIAIISKQLEKDYKEFNQEFLLRDSQNILNATYLLLIATKVEVLGLDCGYCGFATCLDKNKAGKKIPCFFNAEDLGLSVGSAVSVAMERRVDNRIMFSAGRAALRAGLLENNSQCLAIVLSATNKNPFFDRK